MKGKILVIDDNDTMRDGIIKVISKMGHEAKGAAGGHEGLTLFAGSPFDFVIADLKMSDMDGIEVLRKIKDSGKETVVMIITAYGNVETAVEAMKLGAFDFITKPFSPDILRLKVEKALEISRINAENKKLYSENQYFKEQEQANYSERRIIGRSAALKNIQDQVQKVAATNSSVLISGESGTGKELIAREIHNLSPRSDKPFIKVDCSALAEGLLESELFGHEKGAFTGAFYKKLGRFELADGGTLFIDEIGEVSQMIQLKLLRVLQEKEFERVGGTKTVKVDVRIISATNKNLALEVERKNFREDLYYRLHIIPLHMPPLRERLEDIEELSYYFLEKLAKKTSKKVTRIENKALDILKGYPWPGNIRELENMIEQAYVFCEQDTITTKDLPVNIHKPALNGKTIPYHSSLSLDQYLENIEKNLIENTLKENHWIKTRAAKKLGIKTSSLYYKMEKYGLDKIGNF
jgi:two-component system, NtrC family, response regulator HydG